MKLTLPSFVAILALAARAIPASAGAPEPFPRPVFSADRSFRLGAPEPSAVIDDPEIPFRVRVFTASLEKCGTSLSGVQRRIVRLVRPESSLWRVLDQLFPESRERVGKLSLTLLVDDFSDYEGDRPIFNSYYLNSDGPVIGLDCSGDRPAFWLSSLAHELTHALSAGLRLESWWEEGLAQLIEENAGGAQPRITLRALEHARSLPPLLETRRPLPSHESYALSYLFVQYVATQFGDWNILRAMSGLSPSAPACEMEPDFLSVITCRGRAWLEHPENAPDFMSRRYSQDTRRMTPKGLLRYFYVALTMKYSIAPEYRIPRWDGFSPQALSDPGLAPLSPGQGRVLPGSMPVESREAPGSDFETYRIFVDQLGRFRIFPGNAVPGLPQAFKPFQDYRLVINLNPELR